MTVRSEDYVALSNVYATVERWEDVEMVKGDEGQGGREQTWL